MDIRSLEKSQKLGFLFYISYDGKKFHSFDENSDKKSVKSEFIRVANELGFTWAKGVQQGGRTDSEVNALENILYVSSNYKGNLEKLKNQFNEKIDGLKILDIKKTLPNLVIPDLVESREYIYKYPQEKIKKTIEDIQKTCKELSGTYDVSIYTDEKGKNLKENIRSVELSYSDEGLYFVGNSFMPKQVRIMSSVVFSGEKKIFPAKYLYLKKINLKDELLQYIFEENSEIVVEDVSRVESSKALHIFYTKDKGKLLGKNGNNIKALKKQYGNIVVREDKE